MRFFVTGGGSGSCKPSQIVPQESSCLGPVQFFPGLVYRVSVTVRALLLVRLVDEM